MTARARLWPYLNRIRKRLPGYRGPAYSEEVISPPQEVERRAAFILDGQLDMVRPMSEFYRRTHTPIPVEVEIQRLRGGIVTERPVLRRRARDVIVHRWGFANRRDNLRIMERPDAGNLFRTEMTQLQTAADCRQSPAYRFFGHWLFDSCPAVALTDPGETPILSIPEGWQHPGEYLDLMGIDARREPLFFVRDFSWFIDLGCGPHKRGRVKDLRTRVRGQVGGASRGAKRVYIRRLDGGDARVIHNETALIDALDRAGFEIMSPWEMTAAEIAAALHGAEAVVALEGSHLFHAMFTIPDNAMVLGIVPADRFLTVHASAADAAGLLAGVVVMEGDHDRGYRVSPEAVLRTLALAGLD